MHTVPGPVIVLVVGFGLIVTVTFWVLLQPLAVRVITYTTFTGAVVVFTRFSVIALVLPLPAALLIPVTTARVHEYVDGVALVAV